MSANIKQENRILWVDALKFLGIFAIYLGHYADQAGKFYLFVFSYHVPLFFFISGFFAVSSKRESVASFVFKKFKTIIVPYYIFAIIFEIAHAIYYNLSAGEVFVDLLTYVSAIRNTLDSWSLWFFTCLFIVSVIYQLMYLMMKNRVVLFLAALAIYLFVSVDEPALFWNVDSAAIYLVYYALGSLVFSGLNNYISKQRSLKSNLIFFALAACSLAFASIVYFNGRNFVLFQYLPQILNFPILQKLYYFVLVCILMYANIQLALFLSKVNLFVNIGRETLVLCGVEFLTRLIIPSIIGMVGLTISINTPLATLLYSFGCLLFGYYAYVPLWNKYVGPALFFSRHSNAGKLN